MFHNCPRHHLRFMAGRGFTLNYIDESSLEKHPEWNSPDCLEMELIKKEIPEQLEKLGLLDAEAYAKEFAKLDELISEAEIGRETYPILG